MRRENCPSAWEAPEVLSGSEEFILKFAWKTESGPPCVWGVGGPSSEKKRTGLFYKQIPCAVQALEGVEDKAGEELVLDDGSPSATDWGVRAPSVEGKCFWSIPRKNMKALRSLTGGWEGVLDDGGPRGHMERIQLTRLWTDGLGDNQDPKLNLFFYGWMSWVWVGREGNYVISWGADSSWNSQQTLSKCFESTRLELRRKAEIWILESSV